MPRSGYAVAAGHFSQLMTTDVVGGAPQDGGVGKVWLLIKLQLIVCPGENGQEVWGCSSLKNAPEKNLLPVTEGR